MTWTCGSSRHFDMVTDNTGPTCRVCGEPRIMDEDATHMTKERNIAEALRRHAVLFEHEGTSFFELYNAAAAEIERTEEAFQGVLKDNRDLAKKIDQLTEALEQIGGCDCQVAPARHGKACGICITCIARSALEPGTPRSIIAPPSGEPPCTTKTK